MNKNWVYPLSIRNYGSKDNTYSKLLRKFIYNIYQELINIMINEKNMLEDKAVDFVDNLFSLNKNKITKFIENLYSKGLSKKQCANKVLDKYYDITKINLDNTVIEEISDVNEKIDYDFKLSLKNSTSKLFWLFMNKVKNIGLEFKLDTYVITDKENSLNNKDFSFYMKTQKTNVNNIIYEFKYSKILSFFLSFLENDKEDIAFFIGIKNNIIMYGYVLNDINYELGQYSRYTNYDIEKLENYTIKTNNVIDFNILSTKFKRDLEYLWFLKIHLKGFYLINYNDVVNCYTTIINNKITLIIETDENGILSIQYIQDIIEKSNLNKVSYNIFKERIEYTDYYYITIK
jgi:hypothetical protein